MPGVDKHLGTGEAYPRNDEAQRSLVKIIVPLAANMPPTP
jgi:hypothetical protein